MIIPRIAQFPSRKWHFTVSGWTVVCVCALFSPEKSQSQEPIGPLAKKLAQVQFEHYSSAPGYSEGPTWRANEVFFCSGALWRIDAKKVAHKYLEINPAGTVLGTDGHLIVCDNRSKAIVDVSPDGKVGVIVDRFEMQALRSLNDLTIDPRGNIYWTDPEGSSVKNPIGHLFRVRPDGRVDKMATGLAFPNGIDVDPQGKNLYVIESQSKKILRYPLPGDHELLGKPEVFYDLGGSGGDGCAFDQEGNLWVTDFHRPETGKGRITVLSPEAKVLAYLPVPAKVVSNIAFGGVNHDEIFCTTGDPPGVFHAKVGVQGFRGHPAKTYAISRYLNVVPLETHPEAATVRALAKLAIEKPLVNGKFDPAISQQMQNLITGLKDQKLQQNCAALLPELEQAAAQYSRDRKLIAEVQRLGGSVSSEIFAPRWLRSIASDESVPVFGRIVEIILNERTDGHKSPTPKALNDRATDDWLKNLAGQDRLRRLELSGSAVTSAGLKALQELHNLEILNVCLTAVDDRGFEHLTGLINLRRLIVCSSKITGSGFRHLSGAKKLESINLHSSPASDAGLAAIGKLHSLQRLEIVHTNVTDAGLKQLADLKNLRQLHIASHQTTEKALPFLGELRDLVQLDVYERAASNETLEQIAKLPKLRSLMLITGVFDDEGVQHLKNMSTLEDVTLNSGKVTDRSIEHLATWKNLRTLKIGGTKITPEGQKRLAQLLPRTVISP